MSTSQTFTQIIAIGTLIYQIVDEIHEVLRSRRKHRVGTMISIVAMFRIIS